MVLAGENPLPPLPEALPRLRLEGEANLEALEALARSPLTPGELLRILSRGRLPSREEVGRLSGEAERRLAARAPLTALLLHLSSLPRGSRLTLAEAEEVAPGSSPFLPLLAAPPFGLLEEEGEAYRLTRPPHEALWELLEYLWAVAELARERARRRPERTG